MTPGSDTRRFAGPVPLCFDGSDGAAAAIAGAAELLGGRDAVVLTAWEPVATGEPYDPGAVLSAGITKLTSTALGLDEIAREIAGGKLARGVELARSAGFDSRPARTAVLVIPPPGPGS